MAEAFLSVNDVHKSFNSFKAVNGVSFSINKGEIFGLLVAVLRHSALDAGASEVHTAWLGKYRLQ